MHETDQSEERRKVDLLEWTAFDINGGEIRQGIFVFKKNDSFLFVTK